MLTSAIGKAHESLVFDRRVKVLIESIGSLVPSGSKLLDVGTGDGQIAKAIGEQQADVDVRGIDIMLRKKTHIPVEIFDGTTMPLEDKSVDVVTFVDVLHHTDDPSVLIEEASRVARKAVIIKDHLSENTLDHWTLRLMDWVGNAPHGVVLPYNYAPHTAWNGWFSKAGLNVDVFNTDVPLYPAPLSWIFGRKLHFVTRLTPAA